MGSLSPIRTWYLNMPHCRACATSTTATVAGSLGCRPFGEAPPQRWSSLQPKGECNATSVCVCVVWLKIGSKCQLKDVHAPLCCILFFHVKCLPVHLWNKSSVLMFSKEFLKDSMLKAGASPAAAGFVAGAGGGVCQVGLRQERERGGSSVCERERGRRGWGGRQTNLHTHIRSRTHALTLTLSHSLTQSLTLTYSLTHTLSRR